MTIAIAIAVAMLFAGCLCAIRAAVLAIRDLCASLERDRRVEYRHPVLATPARPAPRWLMVASGKAVRRV